MNGGERVASVLAAQGVKSLFTLCGGHISPILVGAKACGIAIVDVRDEASAVFGADATARLTGGVGVAAVTAGPGLTNTITAVKNAQLAQSPVIILGGATATLLRGRGALQDIDQMALMTPHVKWAKALTRVRELVPALEKAFEVAQEGVPGPVFLECPLDLLYGEETIEEFFGAKAGGSSPADIALGAFLKLHQKRLFFGADLRHAGRRVAPALMRPRRDDIRKTARMLREAKRPVLVIGSQATLDTPNIDLLAKAVTRLGIPTYLSGMARGLLGAEHPHWFRHKRGKAIKEADLVLLAGVPCDFRLDYGRQIRGKTPLISVNRSRDDLRMNRRPDLGVLADPGLLLRALGELVDAEPASPRSEWLETLRGRDAARNAEIEVQSQERLEPLNPLEVVKAIDARLADDSVLVADGGDFVATASYVVRPRAPLSWLDPGAFGTLGVGGGFALGARLARPNAEVWILWGDGSAGYTLNEFDTFVRLGLPVIAVVGNDASWGQIARDQVTLLGDAAGTVLARTDYHLVAEGFGGRGLLVEKPSDLGPALDTAKKLAGEGHAVLVNVHLGRSDFRKGSISV